MCGVISTGKTNPQGDGRQTRSCATPKAVAYYCQNASHDMCDGLEDHGRSTRPGEVGLTAYGLARKEVIQ
jgi:hypothetical protein